MQSLLRIGIRIVARANQRKLERIVIAAHAVFRVAGQHHRGRALLRQRTGIGAHGHIHVHGRAVDEPGGVVAARLFGFIGIRRRERQLRHAVFTRAALAPVHLHLIAQRLRALVQRHHDGQRGRGGEARLHFQRAAQLAVGRAGYAHIPANSLTAQVPSDHPAGHAARRVLQNVEEARRAGKKLLPARLIHKGNQRAVDHVELRAEMFVLEYVPLRRVQPRVARIAQRERIVVRRVQHHRLPAAGGNLRVHQQTHIGMPHIADAVRPREPLHRQRAPVQRARDDRLRVAGIVPHRKLGRRGAGRFLAVEQVEHARERRASFGHRRAEAHAVEAHARALGARECRRALFLNGRGVNRFGQRTHRGGIGRARARERFGERRHRVFARVAHAGAGQNIVELAEQHLAPRRLKHARGIGAADQRVGGGRKRFGLAQCVLADAVGRLHAALRRVAAGEHAVQLGIHHGQTVAHGLECAKERAVRRMNQPREHRPRAHFFNISKILPGRPAAVVAHAVHLHRVHHAGFPAKTGHKQREIRVHVAQIPRRLLECQHLRAGGRAPDMRAGSFVPAAVVIILHARLAENLRHVRAVAEGIRLEIEIQRVWIDAQQLGKIVFRIQQVTRHALLGGHVLVRLHPRGSRNLPAPFLYPAANHVQHRGLEFLHDAIGGSLRLRVGELRKFLHQLQHRAERFQRHGDRFMIRPHPVHVDVRVPDHMYRVGLRRVLQRKQNLLRPLRGGLGDRALAFERAQQEIRGFAHNRIVPATLGLAHPVGKGGLHHDALHKQRRFRDTLPRKLSGDIVAIAVPLIQVYALQQRVNPLA